MAQPLLGLSLAPKLITVAEVSQNRSIDPIVQVERSDTCQTALAGLARRESLERSALFKAISESLKVAQSAANTHFNGRVQIPFLSLPPTIHNLADKRTRKDAMVDISLASRDELQAIDITLAAHYAYSLGTSQDLSLEKESCDWEMGVYKAHFLDYNTRTLTISLIDVAENGCVIRAELTSLELGGDAVKNPYSASQAQKPITDTQNANSLQFHPPQPRRFPLSSYPPARLSIQHWR